MTTSQRVRFWLYLSLAIIGLVTAWTFNALAVFENANYVQAWFGSAVDWVLGADLAIVAIAVVIFMFAEGSRLGMKRVWLYVVLSGVTAMAFTLPLFLAMRERHLARANGTSVGG
nr:MAG: hypothetical protein GM42_3455 [actinobacterium acMicro-1]